MYLKHEPALLTLAVFHLDLLQSLLAFTHSFSICRFRFWFLGFILPLVPVLATLFELLFLC